MSTFVMLRVVSYCDTMIASSTLLDLSENDQQAGGYQGPR